MKINRFGLLQASSLMQDMAVSGMGMVFQILLVIFFQVKTHKSESPLFISTEFKASGAFGTCYLIVPRLFMLTQLSMLSNIYP